MAGRGTLPPIDRVLNARLLLPIVFAQHSQYYQNTYQTIKPKRKLRRDARGVQGAYRVSGIRVLGLALGLDLALSLSLSFTALKYVDFDDLFTFVLAYRAPIVLKPHATFIKMVRPHIILGQK